MTVSLSTNTIRLCRGSKSSFIREKKERIEESRKVEIGMSVNNF